MISTLKNFISPNDLFIKYPDMKKTAFLFIIFLGFLLPGCPLIGQIQVGETAPDFTVTDVHGESHTLYTCTASAQFVMLDFFFTTCGPCQYYTPQISMAYETYGCNDGDIVVLGIDYNDTDAEVLQYEETYGGVYPSASGIEGGGNAVVSDYGIIGFPFVCLIDTNNIVVEIFDIPTMQVFSYYFNLYGIEEMECLTKVQENTLAQTFSVYPNPANSFVNIYASAGTLIHVYNSVGVQVAWFKMDSEYYTLDASRFANGFYIVKAIGNGKLITSRLEVLN